MYPTPIKEVERVAAIESYHVIDTPPEAAYDDIAELAAQICQCPVGLINIIADTREWLKAKCGLIPDISYLPRGTTCSTAICQSDLLTVTDLTKDERFANHALVKGAPHFRFYCGTPLVNSEPCPRNGLCFRFQTTGVDPRAIGIIAAGLSPGYGAA